VSPESVRIQVDTTQRVCSRTTKRLFPCCTPAHKKQRLRTYKA